VGPDVRKRPQTEGFTDVLNLVAELAAQRSYESRSSCQRPRRVAALGQQWTICAPHILDLPFVQGGGDRQLPEVGARALARAMPGAHLHEVPNGGHFAYFSCDIATQRRALQDLLSTALPA